MTKEEAKRLLQKVGVICFGHFVCSSELHTNVYVNENALFPKTDATARLCVGIAERVVQAGLRPQTVVAPAIGGVSFGFKTAEILWDSLGEEINPVYAEKDGDGGFVIKRGFKEYVSGRSVLVVEDILTTGTSARETARTVKEAGGRVCAVAALCNRGNVTADDLEASLLVSLCELDLESFPAEDCPLCQEGVPINTDLGHGEEFLKEKNSDQ